MNALKVFGIFNLIFGGLGIICVSPLLIFYGFGLEVFIDLAYDADPSLIGDPDFEELEAMLASGMQWIFGVQGIIAFITSIIFITIGIAQLSKKPIGRIAGLWGSVAYIAINQLLVVTVTYVIIFKYLEPEELIGTIAYDGCMVLLWSIYPILQIIFMSRRSTKIATGELQDTSFIPSNQYQ